MCVYYGDVNSMGSRDRMTLGDDGSTVILSVA